MESGILTNPFSNSIDVGIRLELHEEFNAIKNKSKDRIRFAFFIVFIFFRVDYRFKVKVYELIQLFFL